MSDFLSSENQAIFIFLCIPGGKCIAHYVIGVQWIFVEQTSELRGNKASWL